MLNLNAPRQFGFTLTELMVGGTVGLIILSASVALYGTMVGAASVSLMETQLSTELRQTIDLITRDLRRAGYWAGEPGIDALVSNPFTGNGNHVTIDAVRGESTDSCITFAYDRDQDKHLGVGIKGKGGPLTDRDNVEQVGFRLHTGAVESRINGAGLSCNQGRWQDLTSSNIEITQLHFSLRQKTANLSQPGKDCNGGDYCQYHRHVEVTLTGHLVTRPQTKRTLTDAVQIRNDWVALIPE
ncbi:MAG: hypothetical protein V3S33_07420 [Gammaproteobacteria bacterium]